MEELSTLSELGRFRPDLGVMYWALTPVNFNLQGLLAAV